jgi:hypothetical protein
MKDFNFIKFANSMLNQEKKEWKIDESYVEAMNIRGPAYLPPIFRYGSQANLNKYLRGTISEKEVEDFQKENPPPTLKELSEGTAKLDDNFRYKLTNRELLNQFGVLSKNESLDDSQRVKYGSGSAAFHLYESSEIPVDTDPRSEWAKKYVKMVDELKIPTAAGISGTLDQSIAMAGLVGIGIGNQKEKELEEMKVAYLAFMVPNADHSVHEIMQSTKTYGLDYTPGPGYEEYIYPSGGEDFLHSLYEAQKKRGLEKPSFYLSQEHAAEVAQNIK